MRVIWEIHRTQALYRAIKSRGYRMTGNQIEKNMKSYMVYVGVRSGHVDFQPIPMDPCL